MSFFLNISKGSWIKTKSHGKVLQELKKSFKRPVEKQSFSAKIFCLNKESLGVAGLVFVIAKQGLFTMGVLASSYGARGLYECYEKRHHQVLLKFDSWKVHLNPEKICINNEAKNQYNEDGLPASPIRCALLGITALNLFATVARTIPDFQPTMNKYFVFSAKPGQCYLASSLLSAFPHSDPLHLIYNFNGLLFAQHLWEGLAPMVYIGKDHHNAVDFLSLYVASAVGANFIGLLIKLALKQSYSSHGASGAIMGLLGYLLTTYKDRHLYMAGSSESVPARNLLLALIITNMVMCALLFFGLEKIIDAPVHLGGLIFGMWFAGWGEDIMRRWSDLVSQNWRRHVLREEEESVLSKVAGNLIKRIGTA